MASPKSSKSSSRSTRSKSSKTKSSKSKSSKSRVTSAKSKPSKSKSAKTKLKKRRFANPPTIGFLVAATTAAWQTYTDAFEQELLAYGWKKGVDYNIDYQPAGGAAGDLQTIQNTAQQFVTNGVDIIVTAGTEAAQACQTATTTIPVVFASVGDPVGCELVETIATPGGNLTGCSNMQTDANVVTNRVNSLSKNLKPKMVGVIGNDPPDNTVCVIDAAINQALTALKAAGIPYAQPMSLGQWSPTDFQSVAAVTAKLGPLKAQGVDVLLVCSDPVVAVNVDNIINAAHGPKMNMKTMHEFKESVSGSHKGDHCYGPNFTRLFRQAAWYVYQILNNDADPSTLAVYLPSEYDDLAAS